MINCRNAIIEIVAAITTIILLFPASTHVVALSKRKHLALGFGLAILLPVTFTAAVNRALRGGARREQLMAVE